MKKLFGFVFAALIAVSLLFGCGGEDGIKRTPVKIKKDAERMSKELKRKAR